MCVCVLKPLARTYTPVLGALVSPLGLRTPPSIDFTPFANPMCSRGRAIAHADKGCVCVCVKHRGPDPQTACIALVGDPTHESHGRRAADDAAPRLLHSSP